MSDARQDNIQGKNHNETFIEYLMKLLEDLFESLFSPNKHPYKDSSEAQNNTLKAIEKMEAASQEYRDNGQYAEAYVLSRQTEIFKAAHETAMGKEVDGKVKHWKGSELKSGLFTEVAREVALEKLDALDKDNASKVAFNDYKGTADPVELASVFDNVTATTDAIYDEHFKSKKTKKVLKDLTAMDLNELKEIRDMPTKTPEDLSKGAPSSHLDNNNTRQEKSEKEVDAPELNDLSSGPGR